MNYFRIETLFTELLWSKKTSNHSCEEKFEAFVLRYVLNQLANLEC